MTRIQVESELQQAAADKDTEIQGTEVETGGGRGSVEARCEPGDKRCRKGA